MKFCVIFFLLIVSLHATEPAPRTILVLYDGQDEKPGGVGKLFAESYAEMPLNHLGIKLAFWDVQKGLFDYEEIPDLLGLLVWGNGSWKIQDPLTLMEDIIHLVEQGKKLVLMGLFQFEGETLDEIDLLQKKRSEVFALLGVESLGKTAVKDYNYTFYYKDPMLVGFERPYSGLFPTYELFTVLEGAAVTPVLLVQNEQYSTKPLVWAATNKNGGFVLPNLAVYNDPTGKRDIRRWLVNPFWFFERAYQLKHLPKPDTTTLAGSRIFYSHVDGDGWYNKTYIPPYIDQGSYAAEVLFEEIYKAYPDVPVTIGVIAAEIDPDWVANREGIRLAKEVFALPQVEVGDHTYSHPFYWQFFQHYTQEKEEPFLPLYGETSWNQYAYLSYFGFEETDRRLEKAEEGLPIGYRVPRAFAKAPFNLELETLGSIRKIGELAPENKKVSLYQWSGNTTPFAAAIQLVNKAGIPNINGGDTRFDSHHPSYSWVAPVGRLVGDQRQIYASNSNENTYTNLWTGNFFGFKALPETFYNTEVPLRIKPMNVYYHTYSGERMSSLEAIKLNLDYALNQPSIPIFASQFARIAQGFYSTTFVPVEEQTWDILHRGELETIRFDYALDQQVDFSRSRGVVGQKHLHGSLYVYLDDEEERPRISLEERFDYTQEAKAGVVYLIQANWQVWSLQRASESFSFKTAGFGEGELYFYVPEDGLYTISIHGKQLQKVVVQENKLYLTLPKNFNEEWQVEVRRKHAS